MNRHVLDDALVVDQKVSGEASVELAQGVSLSDRADGLLNILQPDVAAAIWHRDPAPEFQTWLDQLPPEYLPEGRIILSASAIRVALEAMCERCPSSDSDHVEALIDDATMLAERFLSAVDAPYLRLRMDVVTGNACRRFHIDAVKARLICTYRGMGTQYGTASDGVTPEHIHTVPTGSPVILRGTLWPETPIANLRHRSPPIEGTGETRLLFVVDPIFDPDEEA